MSRTLQLTNCNYRFILKPLSPSQAHTPRLSHEVCTFYRAVFGGCMFLLRCDAPGTPLVLLTLCAQPGIVQLQHIDYIRRFSDVSFVSSCGFGGGQNCCLMFSLFDEVWSYGQSPHNCHNQRDTLYRTRFLKCAASTHPVSTYCSTAQCVLSMPDYSGVAYIGRPTRLLIITLLCRFRPIT